MYEMTDWLRPKQELVGNKIKFSVELLQTANPEATDFHYEIDRALCHIRNNNRGVIYLALSGGLDSEYIANALVRNKIFFKPLLLDINNYNEDELWWAKRWCMSNNIEPTIVHVDPEKILTYIEKTYLKEYLTFNLGGYVNIFLADYVKKINSDAILLTGCGDPSINPADIYRDNFQIDEDPDFYYWDIDLLMGIIRPGQHPISTIAYFPETLYSFIYNYNTKVSEQDAKSQMYGIPPRPKVDVYGKVPGWLAFNREMSRFLTMDNHKVGTKKQFLTWLTTNTKEI